MFNPHGCSALSISNEGQLWKAVSAGRLKLLLKPEFLDTALREAEPLVLHLQKLNAGKGMEKEEEAASSFAALKNSDVDLRLG